MSTMTRFPRLAVLSALLLAIGCASTPTPGSDEPAAVSPRATTTAKAGSADATIRSVAAATLEPVYFETDRALLEPDARAALARYAKSVLDHPEWGVLTIEGHCDERGSQEYNLALGARRAAAVKRYLLDLGVPPSRMTTKTFGEERPAVAGGDEKAWRFNRRSELKREKIESAVR